MLKELIASDQRDRECLDKVAELSALSQNRSLPFREILNPLRGSDLDPRARSLAALIRSKSSQAQSDQRGKQQPSSSGGADQASASPESKEQTHAEAALV